MQSNNKVWPHEAPGQRKQKTLVQRAKNIVKWFGVVAGFPLFYINLPCSCCIRNPTASMVLYDDYDPPNGIAKFGENLTTGAIGLGATVCCCCCCFGQCGDFSPKDII